MWVGEEEEQEGMATHMERQWNLCRSHTNIQHMATCCSCWTEQNKCEFSTSRLWSPSEMRPLQCGAPHPYS